VSRGRFHPRLGLLALAASAALGVVDAAGGCGMPDFAIAGVDGAAPGDGASGARDGTTPGGGDGASLDGPPVGDAGSGGFDGNVDAYIAAKCTFPTERGAFVDGRVHCYWRNVANGPWTNGACEPPSGPAGGHLLTVTTGDERNAVRQLYPALVGGDWIGLRTDTGGSMVKGDYRWVTGETTALYDGWETGQPDGTGAYVYWDFTNGTFHDEWHEDSVGSSRNYMCEREFDLPDP